MPLPIQIAALHQRVATSPLGDGRRCGGGLREPPGADVVGDVLPPGGEAPSRRTSGETIELLEFGTDNEVGRDRGPRAGEDHRGVGGDVDL
jgi:hypothetical protein